MDSIKQQIISLIKEYKYVALILAIGVLLMLLPEKQAEPQISSVPSAEPVSQEQRLEEILSQIQGVGRVSVLLTVSEGEKVVYVFDEDLSESTDNRSQSREVVVITDSERTENGLISQVLPPTYLGAVIVCQGGDLPQVQLAVVDAVSDATGLSADKISVLKMK